MQFSTVSTVGTGKPIKVYMFLIHFGQCIFWREFGYSEIKIEKKTVDKERFIWTKQKTKENKNL